MLPELQNALSKYPSDEWEQLSCIDEYENTCRMFDALSISNEIHGNVLGIGFWTGVELPIISHDVLHDPIRLRPQILTFVGIAEDNFYCDFFEEPLKINLLSTMNSHVFKESFWNGTPFDFIFMLRISNLPQQLHICLENDIANMLAPDEVFVASGSGDALDVITHGNDLHILRYTNLDAFTYPYPPFINHHMGFVATKK